MMASGDFKCRRRGCEKRQHSQEADEGGGGGAEPVLPRTRRTERRGQRRNLSLLRAKGQGRRSRGKKSGRQAGGTGTRGQTLQGQSL